MHLLPGVVQTLFIEINMVCTFLIIFVLLLDNEQAVWSKKYAYLVMHKVISGNIILNLTMQEDVWRAWRNCSSSSKRKRHLRRYLLNSF